MASLSPPTLVMLPPPALAQRPSLTLETVSGVSSHHNTELGPWRRGVEGAVASEALCKIPTVSVG